MTGFGLAAAGAAGGLAAAGVAGAGGSRTDRSGMLPSAWRSTSAQGCRTADALDRDAARPVRVEPGQLEPLGVGEQCAARRRGRPSATITLPVADTASGVRLPLIASWPSSLAADAAAKRQIRLRHGEVGLLKRQRDVDAAWRRGGSGRSPPPSRRPGVGTSSSTAAAPFAGHVRSRTTSRAPAISTRVAGLTALSTIAAPASSTSVSRTDSSGASPAAAGPDGAAAARAGRRGRRGGREQRQQREAAVASALDQRPRALRAQAIEAHLRRPRVDEPGGLDRAAP